MVVVEKGEEAANVRALELKERASDVLIYELLCLKQHWVGLACIITPILTVVGIENEEGFPFVLKVVYIESAYMKDVEYTA